jgi:hypothetical protein
MQLLVTHVYWSMIEGDSLNLGIAELIVPIGAFFSCSNTYLIPHYRRVFPKSDTGGELPVQAERSAGQRVGARFIAPNGVVGPTPQAAHPIRHQYQK